MGKELGEEFYNYVFSDENHKVKYFKSYKDTPWKNIWEEICKIMKEHDVKSILDIGCGTGQFAECVHYNNFEKYIGIDFSSKAIDRCLDVLKNINNNYIFINENVLKINFENFEYDCVVATEFLEHIEKDIEVLLKIKSEKLIIFTLPDSDSEGHVRFFPDSIEESFLKIKERYKSIGDIIYINTINYYNGIGKDYLVVIKRS